MHDTILNKIKEWDLISSREEVEDATLKLYYKDIYDHIIFMSDQRYNEYHPTFSSLYPNFVIRFRDWLFKNISDEEDQKVLFRLVPEIFFVGGNEFKALYMSAFQDQVIKWIVEILNLKFDDSNIEDSLNDEIRKTWFCPITDSMVISEFYHINEIRCNGEGYRPDWRTLAKFGEITKIKEYMNKYNLVRLVLLEDYVGCGSQIEDVIDFVGSNFSSIKSMIVPLIVCPDGITTGRLLEAKHASISFAPVLSIPDIACIRSVPLANEPNVFGVIREFILRVHNSVRGNTRDDRTYGPFGYPPGNGTGCLIVMNSNCPDNTLPIIRYKSDLWHYPLFPRLDRE